MVKRFGFTLAEVLITLGIIGVVAAMTIPTLVNNYQKQEIASRLEKAYSVLVQAVKNAEVEIGPSQNWNIPTAEWSSVPSAAWWNEYFVPYSKLKVIKTCTNVNRAECWVASQYLDATFATIPWGAISLLLSDGTALNLEYVSNTSAAIQIDINGLKAPNAFGKDVFSVYLYYPIGKILMAGLGLPRANLLMDASYRCNINPGTSRGNYCGALIQTDGWKIADDYPWN